ncbi:hypothetical protein Cal7507_3220 [Calothrix sp. PCC 7507]|nr:hypothetical protein Cal7507_3220 [Calothrix sp. PCC 7507]
MSSCPNPPGNSDISIYRLPNKISAYDKLLPVEHSKAIDDVSHIYLARYKKYLMLYVLVKDINSESTESCL